MQANDQLRFREMQVIFFLGMAEYPNDKERMEAGLKLLENFIDDLVTRECSKFISENSLLTSGGIRRGGKIKN